MLLEIIKYRKIHTRSEACLLENKSLLSLTALGFLIIPKSDKRNLRNTVWHSQLKKGFQSENEVETTATIHISENKTLAATSYSNVTDMRF